MTARATAAFILGIAFPMVLAGGEAGATLVTTLPPPPPPNFDWNIFGDNLNVSGLTVTAYLKPDGTAGGKIITFDEPVMDPDPDPKEASPEKIGDLHFQFVLWSGVDGKGVLGGGAALFGGFQLTDINDAGHNYSFLQLITDNNPTRADFDQRFGFVNSDFPGYDTKWNFPNTQYDYLDIPFEPALGGAINVSFETALICYSGNTAHVASDFGWSFAFDAAGGLTGTAPAAKAKATDTLLKTYGDDFPGTTYTNDGSCHALANGTGIPEPPSWLLLLGGLLTLWFTRRAPMPFLRTRPARAAYSQSDSDGNRYPL
jgi:hypothetical protein